MLGRVYEAILHRKRRALFEGIPKRSISRSSFRRHARQHGHRFIDVVEDENLRLSMMLPVQPADILRQRAFPGNGHRQKERIQSGIVEAFPDVAPGRQDEAFFIVRHMQCGGAPVRGVASDH